MNDNELKPCPYCGTHIVAHEHDGIYNWVECQNVDCQASGNVVMILGRVEVGEAIAAKKWNTRPIEDALRARIAELEAAIDDALAIIAGGNPDLPGDVLAEVEARLQEVYRGNDSRPLPHD